MATKYRYRVKATCTAYVGEDWTVESNQPLTLDEAEDAVLGDLDLDDDARDIRISCVDQDVSDEHDRSVVSSEDLGAEDVPPEVRHTSCRYCNLDIEGIEPFPPGEWRDRGNNTHCPTPAGDAGQVHQP